jgi:hypothetical protein
MMVYLGVDQPIIDCSSVAHGEVGLDPRVEHPPAELAGKPWVYRVADWCEFGWNCSCIFHYQHMEWADATPDDKERQAFEKLALIVGQAQADGKHPVIFSCWDGEEASLAQIIWDLAPGHTVPERNIFEDVAITGGLPAPTLLRFDPNLKEPVRNVL